MRSRCFAWPSRPQRFEALATPSAALETCTTALAMFHGEILSGAGDGEWVIPHRARLEEVRLGLIEGQLAARLDLGAAGDVIGELEALVRVHPLREGLWALLMVALYRDGRQADALATYQRVRSWLADELGLDPGLQLQQLEQQILVHDASLGVPYSTVRGLGPDAPAGNLPSMSVELVGRETEVAAVSDLLATRRLVEIVGPGGVGKTAVAIAAGRELSASDGVGAWRRLVGPTRNRGDGRRRGRHVGRRVERGRRGGAVRAAQERRRAWSFSTTASTSSTRPRRSPFASSTPPPSCGSCAPARCRSTSTARSCSSSNRLRLPTPSRCSRVEPVRSARTARRATPTMRSRSCAGRSTACRWRSSSPRREPRRCRSRRSPAASTIASTC